MYKTFFEQQNEWSQQRVGKFTASEIWKLLQKGRSRTEYFGETALTYIKGRLAEVLTQEQITDLEGLPAIDWGNANEIDAVLLFEKQKGVKVQYFGKGNPCFIPYSKLPDWAGGSPDGLYDEAVIEVKAPYNSTHHIKHLLAGDAETVKSELPKYYAQIQFNMLCAEKTKGYFISYDPRVLDPKLRLHIVEIPKDEEYIKELEERIDEAVKLLRTYRSCVTPVIIAEHDPEVSATIVH